MNIKSGLSTFLFWYSNFKQTISITFPTINFTLTTFIIQRNLIHLNNKTEIHRIHMQGNYFTYIYKYV